MRSNRTITKVIIDRNGRRLFSQSNSKAEISSFHALFYAHKFSANCPEKSKIKFELEEFLKSKWSRSMPKLISIWEVLWFLSHKTQKEEGLVFGFAGVPGWRRETTNGFIGNNNNFIILKIKKKKIKLKEIERKAGCTCVLYLSPAPNEIRFDSFDN